MKLQRQFKIISKLLVLAQAVFVQKLQGLLHATQYLCSIVKMRFRSLVAFIVGVLILSSFTASSPSFKIGLLKYNGGGDWYANLETSLPNLIKFCNENLGTSIDPEQGIVEVGSPELFNYPLVHITGHGNIIFSTQEAQNLRNYLIGGGFLEVSDNYGLDVFIRREMKKVFPELDFVELPFN